MSDQATPPPASPYGGPPPGQPYGPQGQSFGAQPQLDGAPPPQQGGQPQPGEQYPPVPPQKKSGAGKKVLSILGTILVVLVVIGLKFGVRDFFSDDDKTADAKVGDCISEPPAANGTESSKSADILKCDDAAAKYAVVGRVDDQTRAQAESDAACASFKEAEIVYYTLPDDGGTGYVLCLKPVKK